MGYTHYWRRPRTIPPPTFHAIRSDFERLVLPLSDAGVELAGGLGDGPPEITDNLIRFNGVTDCGHPKNEDIVIPYPSEQAQGLGSSVTAIDGDFYGLGVTLRHRCCNGRCSCETLVLERSKKITSGEEPDENGLFGDCVKTAFRPYDIAVTGSLLIAKRYLREQFVIHSNGADAQWVDARRLCQQVLGYGDWFGIVEEEIEEEWPGSSERRQVLLRTLIEVAEPK